jgi:hypothetical protein
VQPEAADYLGKARRCLEDARKIVAAMPLHRIVAGEAYPAAYDAAEAYILGHTGKTTKAHHGLRTGQRVGARRAAHRRRTAETFLAQAHEFKSLGRHWLALAPAPSTRSRCSARGRVLCARHRAFERYPGRLAQMTGP